MLKNNEIQLLPGNKIKLDLGSTTEKSRLLIVGVIFLVIVLAVGGLLSYLKYNLEEEITKIDSDLGALETKRDKKFEKEVLTLKKQLGLISGLLDSHIYWTEALITFEAQLQEKVRITNFSFEKSSDQINISGFAANYSTLAKQIASFLADSSFQDVILQGATSYNDGTIQFGMILKLDPNKLIKK